MDDGKTAVVLAYHTLSGSRHGQGPRNPLLARADAAHQAGFSAIGVCADDLTIGVDARWLAQKLHQHHVKARTVEWISLDEPPSNEEQTFRLAKVLGVKRINVGVCSAKLPPDMPYYAARLRDLAFRAEDHGQMIVVEPVVFGAVAEIERVQDLIYLAGRPNVGTLLDTYQLARMQWDGIANINPGLVGAIQICGVRHCLIPPSYPDGLLEESQCARLLPHEGDFPVADWLTNLRAAGVDAPVEVEVISDQLRAMHVTDAAQAVASSLQTLGLMARVAA